MKNMHKRILSSCLLVMLFMLSLLSESTYAFWADSILGNQINSNSEVTIGSWTFGPYSPEGISYYDETISYSNGDIIWYNGDIWINHGYTSLNKTPSTANNWTIYNDLNWYSTVTYRLDDLINYNDNIYLSKWEHTNNDPVTSGINGPWENQVSDSLSWVLGQSTILNEIIYSDGQLWINRIGYTTTEPGSTSGWAIYGNLSWSASHIYNTGVIVEQNGLYYKAKWYNNGTSPSTTGQYGVWESLVVPAFSGSVPVASKYTLYNGLLYKALITINSTNNTIVPGSLSSKGIWQAINTQEWQQYNTYANDDLVMYQTNVFELANSANSSDIPGTTTNSWNGMATINYNALNVYQLGEYTVYNSNVYQVVNSTNANNNTPGTIANAWNQINGYQYQWFNVYSAGEIVYYDGAVYIALSQTTNQQPDLASSSTAWDLYQN